MAEGKVCVTCHVWIPLDGYNRRARSPDGRQARCRDCRRAWYTANTAAHKVNTARRTRTGRDRYAKRLFAYLAEHPCVDCGEPDVRLLEFDHLDGSTKLGDVATLVGQLAAWSRIEAEIAKCDVCCANCHRLRTAARGDQRRHRYEVARGRGEHEAASARLAALFAR
jgi:hypothetical protein